MIESTYANTDFQQVADYYTQMNAEETNMALGIINRFGKLFDVTPGEWDTETLYTLI